MQLSQARAEAWGAPPSDFARTAPVPRLPGQGCWVYSKFKSQLGIALFWSGARSLEQIKN